MDLYLADKGLKLFSYNLQFLKIRIRINFLVSTCRCKKSLAKQICNSLQIKMKMKLPYAVAKKCGKADQNEDEDGGKRVEMMFG